MVLHRSARGSAADGGSLRPATVRRRVSITNHLQGTNNDAEPRIKALIVVQRASWLLFPTPLLQGQPVRALESGPFAVTANNAYTLFLTHTEHQR